MKLVLSAVLIVFLVGAPLFLYLASTETELNFLQPVEVIGTQTPVGVEVANPHGIRSLTVQIEQGKQRHTIFEERRPANRFTFWSSQRPPEQVTFSAGTKAAPGLADGNARLIVEAQSNDLRGRLTTLSTDILINTKPPRLSVDNHQHYINHGGSELVVFAVSGYWTEAGVRVGPYTFRSYPMPGAPETKNGSSQRFSLFAVPWDVSVDTKPVVYASNPAGIEVTAGFWYRIFPSDFRTRQLTLSETFVEKMVRRIDPGGEGDVLSRFLRINGEMRRKNNQTLSGLRLKTAERFLWSEPFLQLGNSKVESRFADARDYIYQGKKVDHQVHLGFDLSVTKHVDVAAANDGKVIFAENLGIYGNAVVVDHGYGLQSIYAHLSEFAVKPGDEVKRGQALGQSGQTGLAGGDHLHFSMQLDGVQVNPIEWWDAHWLQDRIFSKVDVPALSGN